MKWPHGLAAAAAVALVAVAVSSSGEGAAEPIHQALRVRAGSTWLRAVRAGQGRPVILLHGFGESLMSWRGVFDHLALTNDVVALDLPGFGLSDKPASGYGNALMAAAVLGAMDSLGVAQAVIVGHSMGGAVALAVAMIEPERVSGLVLLAPAVSASGWGLLIPNDTARASGWLRGAIARYETLRPRFTAPHDPSWLEESPAHLAYSPAADPAYGAALDAVLREFDFDYLSSEDAARLTMPALIVWGEFDQVVPPAVGRALARTMPSATLAIVPRCLHRPHVEKPAEVAELIAGFLQTH